MGNYKEMDVRKLLHATDIETKALSSALIANAASLREVGLEEVVSLQVSSQEQWTQELSEHGITCKIRVEDTLTASSILKLAKEEKASAIMLNLGRRGKQGSHRSLFKGLTKRSTLPLLIVNWGKHATKAFRRDLFEHVVIAMDWSPASDKALDYFLVFQKLVKELEIVNVINGKLTIKDMRLLNDKLTQTRKLCLARGIDAESHVYAGKTAEEIALAAGDYKASLIVLGRNPKKTFAKRLFERSISCEIADRTQVPVLVVP